MALVLASASPRRRELLEMLGAAPLVIPADGEDPVDGGLPPDRAVSLIALNKARAVRGRCAPDDVIIAADTVVYLDGRALGKPADTRDAFEMLSSLSGRKHTVYTGCAVIRGDREVSFTEHADVYFRALSEDEIRRYISTGEPMDKAGAYGAQGFGALLVERIDGDFFCVMGLPICTLNKTLAGFGVNLL